jgi:hypothetical protein
MCSSIRRGKLPNASTNGEKSCNIYKFPLARESAVGSEVSDIDDDIGVDQRSDHERQTLDTKPKCC